MSASPSPLSQSADSDIFVWRSGLALLTFAASLGTLLRYIFLGEVPGLSYKAILNAHSNTALFGWMSLILLHLLGRTFTPTTGGGKAYRRLAWAFVLAQTAASAALLVEGYTLVSSLALSAVVTVSLVWSGRLASDMWKKGNLWGDLRKRFAASSLLFQMTSVIALAVGLGAKSFDIGGPKVFYLFVQLFLHLQFGGWLLFGISALLVNWAIKHGATLSPGILRVYWWCLFLSTPPTYALAVSWMEPDWFVYLINTAGSLLHLAAGVAMLLLILRSENLRLPRTGMTGWLLRLAVCFLGVKFCLVAACASPQVAEFGLSFRGFVIAFVHLITLGIATLLYWGLALDSGYLSSTRLTTAGSWLFLINLAATEALLLGHGLAVIFGWGHLPGYYAALFAAAAGMAFGTALWTVSAFRCSSPKAAKTNPMG